MANATLKEVAEKLVEHCRNHTEAEGLSTLYHPQAVSVEAVDFDGSGHVEVTGIEAIRGKHAWWSENFEVHSGTVDGPHLHGDEKFGVIFEMDATHKASGKRSTSKEIAIYTVKEGKIVREEFFYSM